MCGVIREVSVLVLCRVLWVAAVGYFARFPRVNVREYDGMAP